MICQQIFSIGGAAFPFNQISFENVLRNRVLFALASRSGFGAAFFDAFARSSIVFCISVSADRIVMAASRLLGAMAACVIILSFAAGYHKSWWSSVCIKAAIVISADFVNFGAGDFPFKEPKKNCFEIVVFLLWRQELQFLMPLRVVLYCVSQFSLCRL